MGILLVTAVVTSATLEVIAEECSVQWVRPTGITILTGATLYLTVKLIKEIKSAFIG